MKLKKIKKILKSFRRAKYKKILLSKNDIKLRSDAIEYILELKKKENNKINFNSYEFYSKNLTQENFIHFYKKFNSKIQLKASYDLHNFKKKTNNNACFKSYIIFSNHMMRDRRINNIQKLNTILKINDLLILLFNKYKHSNLVTDFKKNIKFEKKLLKLYL
jgi:hypothetical protein